MAKKKPQPKKKQPKRVEIKLPVSAGPSESHEEVTLVPVPHSETDVATLPEAVGPIRCVLKLCETFWQGTHYVVLTAAPGHELPATLQTGQEVDVSFSPPKGT